MYINLPRPRQTLKMEIKDNVIKTQIVKFFFCLFWMVQLKVAILDVSFAEFVIFIHTLQEFMGTCEKYNSFINLTLLRFLIKLLKIS